MSGIKNHFWHQAPKWIKHKPVALQEHSLQSLEGHSGGVTVVVFSPDSQLLASASVDRTVRLWDLSTGASCGTLKSHSHWVSALAFSPDGQVLVSASYDHTVKLWDPSTASLLPLDWARWLRWRSGAYSPHQSKAAGIRPVACSPHAEEED